MDRTSPVPLYFQVARYIEDAIEAGDLLPGVRLDNEIQLAEQLGLSRPTMRRAMQYLVDRGLLVRRRGIGTQVAHPKVKRSVELSSLWDDLSRGGQEPSTTVLSIRTEPASSEPARQLGIPEGTPVVALERLRYAHGEPLARLRNFLPVDLAPTLTTEALEQRGLYEVLRATGITLHAAVQTIGARAGTPAETQLLDEPRRAPLLTMERTTYADSGTAVEYGTHIYRASRYSFELSLLAR